MKKSQLLWEKFAEFAIKHRISAIVFSIILTILSVAMAPSVPFSADPTEFLPNDDENVNFWLDMTNRFGGFNLLMVGLEETDEAFSFDGLVKLAKISDKLNEQKAKGVLLARSITNVPTIQEGEDGTLNTSLLIRSIPRTDNEREKLKQRILADSQVPGSLISTDLKGYIVLIRTDERKNQSDIAELVYNIVEEEKGHLNAVYFGAPFIGIQLGRKIYNQIPWLVPIFAVFIFLLPIIYIRNISATIIVILSSAAPLLWWFALLVILGVPLSTSALNASLLILAIGILVFGRAAQVWLGRNEDEEPNPLSSRMVGALILMAIAFVIVSQMTVPFLSGFLLAASVGMLAIILFGTLCFVPLITMLKRFEQAKTRENSRSIWYFSPKFIYGVSLAAIILAAIPLTDLRFFVDPRNIFAKEDDMGKAISFFDNHFGGVDFIQINARGDFRNPNDIKRLARTTDLLEGTGAFVDVRSITQTVNFLGEQFDGLYRIPQSRDALDNLWFFLEGSVDIKPLVSDNRKEAMIAARIPGITDLKAKDWVNAAKKAIKDSLITGEKSTFLRIQAIAKRYQISITKSDIDSLISHMNTPQFKDETKYTNEVIAKLHSFMQSEDSPFTLKDDDWKTIAGIIKTNDKDKLAKLVSAISSFDSYKELEYPPEVAKDVAETLLSSKSNMIIKFKTTELVDLLKNTIKTKDAPRPFFVRARGVFSDLLENNAKAADNVEFKVSGYPALIPKASQTLKSAVLKTVFPLWIFAILIAFFITKSKSATIRISIEVLLVGLLTFAAASLTGLNMDSGSATLFLLPPVFILFLSPNMHKPLPGGSLTYTRYASIFALSIMLATASLSFTGILPLVRISMIMSFGIAISWIVINISRRIGVK